MDGEDHTFALLFDANPRPMWVTDRETLEFLVVNEAMCSRYGWTRDELAAMTLRDLRPPDRRPEFDQIYAAAKTAPTFTRAGHHWTKSGERFDVHLEVTHVTFRGRAASLTVMTDVTDASEAERRFRFLVEHSADGIAMTNTKHVIEYMSPGALRMLGYDSEEFVGTTSELRAHPDDVKAWRPYELGETRTDVTRMMHRDGSWRWIESSTTNLTHEPAVRAYVSNFHDITERVRVEDSLRRSEANFRALIERSPSATFVHREGKYVYVNSTAVTMLRWDSAADIVGRDVLAFVHPDDRDRLRDAILHAERGGGPGRGEARMLRRDGTSFVIEAELIIMDFDGQPSAVVIGRDVTEPREMLARLALADRMLSVGTLAAGVAHEINNPLAFIGANLQIIDTELESLLATGRSRLPADDLRALAADAREGVSRVTAIVRDLRALARPEDETRGPVDIAAVLASSVKMASNEIRHRARVVQTYEPDLPLVQGDASRLGQVCLNLLLNAAHAIAVGSADRNEITVRARRAGADRVCIEVEDTGRGIPQASLRRIFDPFYTTKARGEGIGLGLTITHQIVTALDGEIAVDSTIGFGSTFRVTLPIARREEAQPAVEPPPRQASVARILLIDDEPAVGRSLTALLAPQTEVVSVTRARDALDRLATGEVFDAIVCDVMMPEITGIELYERLLPEQARRVIFMTGGAFTPQAREFLTKVDRPRLEKPFTEEALLRALETARLAGR